MKQIWKISGLTRSLEDAVTRAENEKSEKKKALLAQQWEEELKFKILKLEQKAKTVHLLEQATAKSASKSNMKMLKLVISKYDGDYEKWLSF